MKGSQKQFSRFLNSEYNDDYLEPLEGDDDHTSLSTNHEQQSNAGYKGNYSLKTNAQTVPKRASDAAMKPLTSELIDDFTAFLGYNAMEYYKNLSEVTPIKSPQILDTYRDFYTKFETIPVLFLSIVPNKAVYLWQVNRLCPYQKNSNSAIVDSKNLESDTCPNISVLMLAMIKPEAQETIIQADLIGDTQICIKSKAGQDQLVIRVYNIKDFVKKVRVNPCKEELTANEHCSSKLVINGSQSEDKSLYTWEVILVSQDTGENDAKKSTRKVEIKVDEELGQEFYFDKESFPHVFQGNKGEVFFVDKQTTTFIALDDDSIGMWHFKIGEIKRLHIYNNELFMSTSRNGYWRIAFEGHYAGESKFISSFEYDKSFDKYTSSLNKEIYFEKDKHKYHDNKNFVYNVPLALRNPSRPMNSGESEEQKAAEEGIDLVKNKLKNKRDGDWDNEERTEILKEIRTAIKSGIKKSHDEPQLEETDTLFRVPKETLQLYQEVKREKKFNIKQKEKEKTKTKTNMRSLKDDM